MITNHRAYVLVLLLVGTSGCNLAGDDEPAAADDACPKGTSRATERTKMIGMIDVGTRHVCTPCEAGSYCPGLGSGASKCTNGTYDDDRDPTTPCVGMTTCHPGSFVRTHGSGTENRLCAPCPAGTFSNGANATTCSRCTAGTFCPSGSPGPSACAGNTWDDDGDPATPCIARTACPPGTEDTNPGSPTSDAVCVVCPPGTYGDGARGCVVDPGCPPGTVQVAAGTTTSPAVCERCAAGETCAGGTAPKVACEDGTWDDDGSPATPCIAWSTCGPGLYVDPNGGSATRDQCLPCPSGTYSDGVMAKACIAQRDCASGTYVAVPPSAAADRTCAACPAGTADTIANAVTCGAAQEIAAGDFMTCARMSNGVVRCWGDYHDAADVALPRPARTVALGSAHGCALLDDGTVACWGANINYQHGLGTQTSATDPTIVPGLSDVVEVVAQSNATYARRSDGTVLAWGEIDDALGLDCDSSKYDCGFYTAPSLVLSTPTVELSMFARFGVDNGVACTAVHGVLRCVDLFSRFEHSWSLSSVEAIAGSCARTASGSATCWTWYEGPDAMLPDAAGVTSIAARLEHTCVAAAGRAACWGDNNEGVLGDGTTDWRLAPVYVPGLDEVVSVATGSRHTCALRVDGSVYCWGANWAGQLGNGTTTRSLSPTRVLGL